MPAQGDDRRLRRLADVQPGNVELQRVDVDDVRAVEVGAGERGDRLGLVLHVGVVQPLAGDLDRLDVGRGGAEMSRSTGRALLEHSSWPLAIAGEDSSETVRSTRCAG